MRAISLHQPWASAMVLGHKANETRHWDIRAHGPLLIHAAKIPIWKNPATGILPIEILEWLHKEGWIDFIKEIDRLPYGAIIGKVEACLTWPTHVLRPQISHKELMHGNYEDGRYALVTQNPVAFEHHIPYRGQQGFFNVADYVIADALVEAERAAEAEEAGERR